jgi:hypothetical protein
VISKYELKKRESREVSEVVSSFDPSILQELRDEIAAPKATADEAKKDSADAKDAASDAQWDATSTQDAVSDVDEIKGIRGLGTEKSWSLSG